MNRTPAPIKNRNKVARAAWERQGAGKHDSRPNRQRTRAGARHAAIRESW